MSNTDKILSWLTYAESWAPLICWTTGCLIIATLLIILVLRLLNLRRLLKQPYVFLELTPPATGDKSPQATKQLLAVLHGLQTSRPLLDKLLLRGIVFAPELVSTKEHGIRYVWRVAEGQASNFEQAIISYVPDIRIKHIEDPLLNQAGVIRVLEFKQTGHIAYPLQRQGDPERHDPIAYVTGAMTQLVPDEQIAFQVVVAPVRVPSAEVLARRIMANEELVYKLGKRRLLNGGGIVRAINTVLLGILDGIGDAASGTHSRYQAQSEARRRQEVAAKIRPARMLPVLEQELADSVHDKLSQPLFRVTIRALIMTRDKQSAQKRIVGVRNSLAVFKTPKYQSLGMRLNFPVTLRRRYRLFAFKHRLPSFFASRACLLSASEIAELYHFPNTQSAKTENIAKSLSKTLPAPLSLKGKTNFDVVLGRNSHHGVITDIGLTAAERERHVYIVGSTGNGKSTMLAYAIIQDIQNGKGVAIIDPHGDLARYVLRYIPKERVNDVVYLNPVDIKYPPGLNILELPEGLDEDELLLEQQRVTEAVISVMRKVFDDDESTGAHRIEDMLRNSIHTAMTIKDATLFTILKLLRNENYRKRIVADLEDEYLKDFWREELGKAGSMQRVSMSKGVTSRIDRFRTSPSAKRILEQPKSTINFEDIINSGKILICNFAEGEIGEDTSALFGTTVMAELKMAAERRAKLAPSERRPFYVYVDEFQNFATEAFTKMLSGSRKYKLFLTIAQQSTAQQETQRMTEALLSNLSTIICFRTGSPADEELLLSRFTPYLELGDISNLPTYNFYARLSAVTPQEPVSGMTLLPESDGSDEIARQVIAASRANYAKEHVPPKTKKAKTNDTKADAPKTDQAEDNIMPILDAPGDT